MYIQTKMAEQPGMHKNHRVYKKGFREYVTPSNGYSNGKEKEDQVGNGPCKIEIYIYMCKIGPSWLSSLAYLKVIKNFWRVGDRYFERKSGLGLGHRRLRG